MSIVTQAPLRILAVEDSATDAQLIVRELQRSGFNPVCDRVDNQEAMRDAMTRQSYHLVTSDFSMPGFDALRALQVAKELAPEVPFIVVSGTITDEAAVRAMRAGAADYVTKDRLLRLPAAVSRELAEAAQRKAHRISQAAQVSAERNFHDLIERLPLGILIHRDAKVVFANPFSLRYLGLRVPDELIGKPLLDLIAPEDRKVVAERMAAIDRGEPVLPAEVRLLCHDGQQRAIEIFGFPLLFDGLPATVAVARDITAEREMHRQLMFADRMVSMGTLVAGVAHEINNPLAYIQANLDFAIANLDAEVKQSPRAAAIETRDALAEAFQGATRVRNIVRDLQTFSRPDDSMYAPIDVRPVLESSLQMAMVEIRHRAALVRDYGEVPLVLGNDARLGQVFLNLLVNAAHAIPEGNSEKNEIRITTSTDASGRAVIAIRDSGAGMTPEIQRRIFDPFFTTKPVGVGTGLGLAICQGIVTSLKGTISVASTLGVGTEFTVVLPSAPTGRELEEQGQPPERAASLQGGRVLIIDDEVLVAKSLRRLLEPDFQVEVALDAAEALAKIADGDRYSAILCDLMMPGLSGMQVYERLFAVAPDQAERIVFMTGGAFTEAASTFLSRARNPCVHKPFESAQLKEALQLLGLRNPAA